MRARQALTGFQFRPIVAPQMVLHLAAKYVRGGKGIGNGGNRLVLQMKLLCAAGKLIMIGCRLFSQTFIKSGPIADQQRTHLAQTGIIFRQNSQHRGIVVLILQNSAFLLQNSVVFRQRRVIIGPQGAQRLIPQPPPGGSAGFQHHQILGTEQNTGKQSGNVTGGLLFDPIVPQLPGAAAVEQHPTDVLLPLLGKNVAVNLAKIFFKADQFPGPLGPEAFSRAQIADGFQQIGLTLGIVAHDEIHTGLKFQLNLAVIAKTPEL